MKAALLLSVRLFFYVLALAFLTSCASPPSPTLVDNDPPMGDTPTATVVVNTPSLPPSRTPFQPLPTTAITFPMPSATATATLTPTVLPEISLLFTGVIVPARCVQAAIDARGNADYIFEAVREIVTQADLAIGVLNATISDYPPRTGCRQTYVLVGGSSNADAIARAGFDVMNVATNHIKNCGIGDCGDRAFFDTLENLRRVGILPVGAGNTLAEALQPLVVTLQGVRFGFVALGLIEPQAFASETSPGIAVLTEENLRQAIAAAREVSDVVIAMPHMGPEDSPHPQEYQQKFAQIAVEAGADLVVGNHTHVVQGMQRIRGVQVFYGLGNFVFDQDWDLAHQQGVIAIVRFRGAEYVGYELIPTHVDGDGTVRLATGDEAAQILKRIEDASLPEK